MFAGGKYRNGLKQLFLSLLVPFLLSSNKTENL